MILVIIAAIVITLALLLKDKDDKDDKDDKGDKYDKGDKEEEIFIDKTHILRNNTDFIKPNNKNKQYQLNELDKSKYKFILVQDPYILIGGIEIKTFGYDTDVVDGFAHYAEHIFFGGTENITELDLFSLVGTYDEFLNTYTANEETVFQYFGSNYTFEKVLNYISNFIQKPLINKTYLETEKRVVNSEYDSYNISDRNIFQIYMENSNPKNGFYCNETGHAGTVETLSTVSIDYLKNIIEYYLSLKIIIFFYIRQGHLKK